jgi:hypothetical protein
MCTYAVALGVAQDGAHVGVLDRVAAAALEVAVAAVLRFVLPTFRHELQVHLGAGMPAAGGALW